MAHRTLAAIALAAVLSLGAAASAPAPAMAQSGGAQTAPAESFTEQKLEAYVVAAIEVSQIVESMRPDMQAAQQSGDEAEIQAVREDLGARLTSAVEDVDGITVDEYQQITNAARGDDQLLARIREIAADMQG
jgi:hypothetical protein